LLSEIELVLENFIGQGEALLSEYENSKKQLRSVSTELTRDGLSELAGLLACEVIPGTRRKVRKYSGRILKAQSKATQRPIPDPMRNSQQHKRV